MKLRRFAVRHWRPLTVYVALGLALWPVPLLGLLHVEASAVVACVAFFVSGVAALSAFEGDRSVSFEGVLSVQEGLLFVPLLLLTVTLLWRPNCDYGRGLMLFLAMPPVTVAFSVGLAYGLTGLGIRYAKTSLVLIGLVIGLGGPLYDLGWHPQFYTYNHLFGGVLGPIYDRELALRPGFFFFRLLTLLWAGLFYIIGCWGRARSRKLTEGEEETARRRTVQEKGRAKTGQTSMLFRWRFTIDCRTSYLLAFLGVAALIGAAYANAARLGFNTPAWYLQRQLGGHLRTAHFDLYYDPASVSKARLKFLAEDQEWRYHWLKKRLGTAPSERIATYLYPDEETKARLTGARQTSVAPVWLGHPQVHLLQRAYEASFGHELVHAFSREFGMPVVNASRSVGLVEGLAVAFEPPTGRPSPADQVSAAALMEGEGHAVWLAEDVAERLSPLGFWTGREAVSYTTMGAFVRFLATHYETDKLRAVYAWANFEDVYGKSVRQLAREWEEALLAQPTVARGAGALVERRFSRLSLFEVACPHYVPPYVRAFRAGRQALAEGDTTAAQASFREALKQQPAFETARVSIARLLLARAEPAGRQDERMVEALRLLRAAPDSVHTRSFFVARGDARAMLGASKAAHESYERARDQLLPYRREARALIVLRSALVGRPELVGELVGGGTALRKAHRLRASGTRLGRVAKIVRAVLLAEGKRFGQAARLLERTQVPDGFASEQARRTLRQQRIVWLAQWWYRAGCERRARNYAQRAVQAFRTFGDLDAAARWKSFAGKMKWIASRPPIPVVQQSR